MKQVRKILKNRKFFYYGVSGILTTIISLITYKFFLMIKLQYILAFTFSQILAITFAFFSTRKCVFNSKAMNKREISKEYIRFLMGRTFTYGINLILLMIMVDLFKFDKFYSNAVITIIVIILNFFVGDFVINKIRL